MKIREPFAKILAVFLTFLLLVPQAVVAQSESKEKPWR